jgi:hypothetical protein
VRASTNASKKCRTCPASKKVQDKDGVKFDVKVKEGWGRAHTIEAPDEWVTRASRGRKWDFHFAFFQSRALL